MNAVSPFYSPFAVGSPEHPGRCRWSSDANPSPLFSQRNYPESVLSAEVFGRLTGYDPDFAGGYHRFYNTEHEAMAARSAAATPEPTPCPS